MPVLCIQTFSKWEIFGVDDFCVSLFMITPNDFFYVPLNLNCQLKWLFNYYHCLSQEISELRDQLRDLMFFLEAKQTLASTTEATQQEIQDGQIIVQPPTASGHAGKKARKKTR